MLESDIFASKTYKKDKYSRERQHGYRRMVCWREVHKMPGVVVAPCEQNAQNAACL